MLRAIYRPDNGLNEHEKVVMTCLAQHANEMGTCFPSVSTVAKECSISRSTALRAIEGLTKKGWITPNKRNGCVTTYTCRIPATGILQEPVSDRYRYHTETGIPQTPDQYPTDTGQPVSERNRYQTETGPVSDRHRTGVPQTPELYQELNKNNVDVYNVVDDAGDENFQKVAQHFLKRKGKGLWLSPLDEQEIHDLLAESIPVDVIIQGIDRAFDNYRPRFRGDEISSFRYCAKVARRLWAERKDEKTGGKVVPLKTEHQPTPPYWEKFDEEKYRQQCEEAQRRAEELGIDLAWQAKMLEKKFGHLPTPAWLKPYVDRVKKEMEQQSVGS